MKTIIIDGVEYNLTPKVAFREGDWVVDGNFVTQITGIEDDGYTNSDQGFISFETAKNFHLWTVKDAKDGDVLCTYECGTPKIVFILKGTPKKHYALGYHCYYNIMYPHFGPDSEKGCLAPNDEDVKPATKEQRDTLERAITNAGYTFNFEKKELKKIEKKSQRMVSAEAKEALYDKPTDEEMKELLRTEYEKGRADAYCEMYVPTQISPEESLGVSSEKYEDIVATLTQGGQKPAKWSLEDERVIAIINNALTESNTPPDDYDKVYDWLESLRKRIGG